MIKNFLSFGEQKEFNMIPSRSKRLGHHKFNFQDIELLKFSSIYGANGAGKSNLIRAMLALQKIILHEKLPVDIKNTIFKLSEEQNESTQILGVEFIQNNKAFYYTIEITDKCITTEELYESGLGRKDDVLIFERKSDKNNNTTLKFLDAFENDEESKAFKKVLEKNFIKPDKPIFKLLTTLDNSYLKDVDIALEWFNSTLQIMTPKSKPEAFVHKIDIDQNFKKFAEDMICSFNTGICGIESQKRSINELKTKENDEAIEEILKQLDETESDFITGRTQTGQEIVFTKENDDIYAKNLVLKHELKDGSSKPFSLNEVSDGTKRLIDFVPAFSRIITENSVLLIDEIERSIHPLLIKELLKKVSKDKKIQGQLIFTTHESNLLDQEILRQDEIWFIEKDNNGNSDLYSLSDFKVHHTKNIRKGYLNGRYGAIPFLSNLSDLNWHNYDTEK